jgi:S-adenosylmethionine:tRNA-ribosyltransferase-isomerase (queuine synthetase)
LRKLARKNIEKAFVTLHVDCRNIKPVKARNHAEHVTEYIDVR